MMPEGEGESPIDAVFARFAAALARLSAPLDALADSLYGLTRGPGASNDTLRRRVAYGGRKGRRAARRLRAAGVKP